MATVRLSLAPANGNHPPFTVSKIKGLLLLLKGYCSAKSNCFCSSWANCEKASENAARAPLGKPIFGTCSLPYDFRCLKISMFGETDRVRSPRKIPFCKLAVQQ